MSDEVCGAECADGTPCQHPPNCPVPSHSDPDAENPQGRPSKLDDRRDDILAGARQGMTMEGCARLAGVSKDTLYRWIDEYPEFSDALNRARAQGELQHLQSVNDAGSRFVLERSFGYTKSQEIEHSGEVDVEVEADFSDTST